MKITYLLNKEQADGSVRLSVATADEWRAAVKGNANLHTNERRHFIYDYIAEGDDLDLIVIEAPLAEYREWHKARMASERRRAWEKKVRILPMDSWLFDESDPEQFRDAFQSEEQVEDLVCAEMMINELREQLAEWRPWAVEMLDFYLAGRKRECTGILARRYGVSVQAVRKYKRQFEEFVKKFYEKILP